MMSRAKQNNQRVDLVVVGGVQLGVMVEREVRTRHILSGPRDKLTY